MFFRNLANSDKQADLKISIVGGSNSVMRRGYVKYLSSEIGKLISKVSSANYYSLCGVPNIFGTIQKTDMILLIKATLYFLNIALMTVMLLKQTINRWS